MANPTAVVTLPVGKIVDLDLRPGEVWALNSGADVRFLPEPRRDRVVWAAGFLDGEGCILIERRRNHSGRGWNYKLYTRVSNNDPAPLEIFKDLFGGYITTQKKPATTKSISHWHGGCRIAAKALRELLPYLVVKREQAEIAISFQERRAKHTGPGHFSLDPEQDERDRLRLKELKRA